MEVSLTLSLLLVLLAALVCLAAYKYCSQPYYVVNFKKNGIPGPTPIPFLGSFYMIRKHGFIHFPAQLLKDYGPVVGVYLGARPLVIVGDATVLRFLYVENSDYFNDRESLPDFFNKAAGLPPGLFMSRGEEWKRSRVAMCPAFSVQNLRMVANCMGSTCYSLSDALKSQANSNKSIHIDKLVGDYVIECTAAMVFGDIADCEKKQLVECTTKLWTAVNENVVTMLWFTLSHFPWLGSVIGSLLKYSSTGHYFMKMYEICTRMVTEKANKKTSKTIIQLISESQFEDKGRLRKPTTKEVVSHAINFIMAGFETTSSTLGFTAYLLAMNPTVQEKVHDEIVKYFKSKPEASLFDAAKEIEYVEMVVQESLRLLPPVAGIARYCGKTVHYNGFTIPEGVTIYAAVYQIHHNPEYWPEPDKFIPERFSQEEKAKRHSDVHIPFGLGPRNCIGSRFALLQVKMMLIEMLRAVKFIQAPDTQVPLRTSYRLSIAPADGIFLRLESW